MLYSPHDWTTDVSTIANRFQDPKARSGIEGCRVQILAQVSDCQVRS